MLFQSFRIISVKTIVSHVGNWRAADLIDPLAHARCMIAVLHMLHHSHLSLQNVPYFLDEDKEIRLSL